MPTEHTITYTLYQYEELSDKAKEKARDWYKELAGTYFVDDVEYDDFIEICRLMGVDIAVNYRDGRSEPKIFWSGFWSQGDGACFHASYEAKPDAGEAIRGYAPQDEALHAIGDQLADFAKRFPGFAGKVSQPYGGCDSHARTMYTETEYGQDEDGYAMPLPDEAETELRDILRSLADWFYRYLEAEYEYRTGDEEAESAIEANEYTFTKEGERKD